MQAYRAAEKNSNTISIIVNRLELLPDYAQHEVLDFVEFLRTRQMQYEAGRTEDNSWSNFSLASAMRGMEDEETPYTSTDIIEPCK